METDVNKLQEMVCELRSELEWAELTAANYNHKLKEAQLKECRARIKANNQRLISIGFAVIALVACLMLVF